VNLASQLQSLPEIASTVKNLTLQWYNDIISDVVAEFSQLRRLNLLLTSRIDLKRLFESFDAAKLSLRALSVKVIELWSAEAIEEYSSHRRKIELGHSGYTELVAVEAAPVPDASHLVNGMTSLTFLHWGFPHAFFITPPNPTTLLALTDLEYTVDCDSASQWLAKCQ